MKAVGAYKCDYTGRIFESAYDAKRCEFHAMMKKVAGQLPAMGSISPISIMDWLAVNLEGASYPSAAPELLRALQYLLKDEHKDQ